MMAAPDEGARGASPVPDDEHTFPHFPSTRSEAPGFAPSIISSRMTDIMSDEGTIPEVPGQKTRPGRSSARNSHLAQFQPLRRGLSGRQDGASGNTSASGTTVAYGGRPVSSTSRSHVPSLTSHAFFHPMSSQKLQAQRGSVTRPRHSQIGLQQQLAGAGAGEMAVAGGAGGAAVSQPTAPYARPISRGSECTDQMTVDRRTANTSPTGGFYNTASLTDSVRPLYQQNQGVFGAAGGAAAGGADGADGDDAGGKRQATGPGGLTIRVDKTLKSGNVNNLPTPVRTPMSFRSSFMLPGKGSSGDGGNRDMQGGEKLESVASTPQRSPSAVSHPSNGTHVNSSSPTPDGGRKAQSSAPGSKGSAGSAGSARTVTYTGKNYQFFMGNTVFCLGGRLENTRSRPINVATGAMVVIPSILFFAFSAPWLWRHVSPAVPIIFAYLTYICVSSFLHASLSDPGVSQPNAPSCLFT